MEQWKQIPNFPDYQVSSLGKIKRLVPSIRKRDYGPINGSVFRGYVMACLRTPLGEKKRVAVHRMVMLAFRGPSDLHVNHINGVKNDNRLENLEYVTDKQNREHAKHVLDAFPKGAKHPNSKLTESDVLGILKLIDQGLSDGMVANVYGCTPANVWMIRKGRAWAHLSTGPRPANFKGRRSLS
jgi:hypothetical protein